MLTLFPLAGISAQPHLLKKTHTQKRTTTNDWCITTLRRFSVKSIKMQRRQGFQSIPEASWHHEKWLPEDRVSVREAAGKQSDKQRTNTKKGTLNAGLYAFPFEQTSVRCHCWRRFYLGYLPETAKAQWAQFQSVYCLQVLISAESSEKSVVYSQKSAICSLNRCFLYLNEIRGLLLNTLNAIKTLLVGKFLNTLCMRLSVSPVLEMQMYDQEQKYCCCGN